MAKKTAKRSAPAKPARPNTIIVVTEKELRRIKKSLASKTEFPEQYEDKNLPIDQRLEYKWRTHLLKQDLAPLEKRVLDNFSHFTLAGFSAEGNTFFPIARCYSKSNNYFEYYMKNAEIFIINISYE